MPRVIDPSAEPLLETFPLLLHVGESYPCSLTPELKAQSPLRYACGYHFVLCFLVLIQGYPLSAPLLLSLQLLHNLLSAQTQKGLDVTEVLFSAALYVQAHFYIVLLSCLSHSAPTLQTLLGRTGEWEYRCLVHICCVLNTDTLRYI